MAISRTAWIDEAPLATPPVEGTPLNNAAKQALYDEIDAALAALTTASVPVIRTVNGHALSVDITVTKSDVGLSAVENTALSTWGGSSAIVTLGTVATGTWQATPIATAYLVLTSVVPIIRTVNGHALSADITVTKSDVGLSAVENTALSTWGGSSAITLVGTLATLTVTAPIAGSITGSSGSTTGNAATVTTNANLTGPVTSVGNATSIAAGAIAYSKLTLTGAVVNTDLAGSITASKLVVTDLVLTESQITGLVSDLALKAPLASPTLTGVPTAPTAAVSTNTTQIASTAFAMAAVAVETAARIAAVSGVTDATLPFTDIITNNVSITAHGFTPKLSGTATQYLAGDGTWTTPVGVVTTQTTTAVGSTATVNLTGYPFTFLRCNGASALVLLGLTSNGNGHVVFLSNVSGFSITINDQDAGASAANRIITGTAAPLVLSATGWAILIKDGTTSRWRIIGSSVGTVSVPVTRVTSITSSATPTPNADTDDLLDITALAVAAAFATPGGTPVNGQKLMLRIKDTGTARALTYSSAYVAGGAPLPSTTIISKTLLIGLLYNTANALNKWMCVAVSQEA
jgi:hypothetical protein